MINQLYYGDCLDVLKQLSKDNPKGFIDLIYIDPPFNSKRNYNILFESADLKDSKAQKEAFADTWSNVSYKDTLSELAILDHNLYTFLNTLDTLNIPKSAVSYLTTMAIRIHYMRKVLKDTGSFYLHCDQTMSHYLKIVCDMVFGSNHFKNEIIWKRTFNSGSSKSVARKYPNNVDTIFYYTKSDDYTFNKTFRPYSAGAIKRYDKVDEQGRRFKWNPLKTYSEKRLEDLLKTGEAKIIPTSKYPVYKHYFDDTKGAPIDNLWDDIEQLGTKAAERLDYPTQKPEALLERIVSTSSNEGDLVADFFCGCGTTIAAAQNLKRNWLGVDISHLSIGLIERKRLIEPYLGSVEKVKPKYEIHGLPLDIGSAKQLANNEKGGRLKFEQWVVEAKLSAVLNDTKNQLGHDGYTVFDLNGEKHLVLIEVKSGGATVTQLNHFIKTVDSKKASLGVFVCFENEVTKNMQLAAKNEGYFMKEAYGTQYDKVQILTVEDLLKGEGIRIPYSTNQVFKTSKKKITSESSQGELGF